MKEKTAAEISNTIGCSVQSVHSAYRNGYLLRGNFRVEKIVEDVVKVEKKVVPDKFPEEWRQMMRMFQNVTWVQSGGKVLKVQVKRK